MFLSIVVPVYNEEAALPLLLPALIQTLDGLDVGGYEVLFVNDGSRDATGPVLSAAAALDSRLKVIQFSRNFGHQAAVTAGLDAATGDAAVVMDADLQDPPEVLVEMLRLFRAGCDVVSPRRVSRAGDAWFKRATAAGFYWLMRKGVDERLASQVGDFRLYSRRAVLAMRGLRERHRFLRGMVAWLGLKEAFVPFHRAPRAAGETKYPLRKMLRFAWTAITSSSAAPLRLTSLAGVCLTGIGVCYLMYVLYVALVERSAVPGWSSLASLQVLFSGAILLAIGLVGDYLARVYEEAKGRPLYVVSATQNVLAPADAARTVWLPNRPPEAAPGEVPPPNEPVTAGGNP